MNEYMGVIFQKRIKRKELEFEERWKKSLAEWKNT